MSSKPLIRKFFAGATVILLLVFAAVALAPFYVNGSLLRDTLAARLAQFSGGDVTIKGRVSLESYLTLSIEANDVEILGVKNLGPIDAVHAGKITASIDWMDLIAGTRRFDELTIEAPKIALRPLGEGQDFAKIVADGIKTLETTPFETIRVKTVSFTRDGAVFPLAASSARFNRSGNGRRLAAKGNIVWKDEALSFRARRGRKTKTGDIVTAPLDVEINGQPLNVSFTGSLNIEPALALKGELELSASSASKLPQWFNLDWSLPKTIGPITGDGELHWTSEAVVLDSATISVNGYDADGAISISTSDACPKLEGDLAFRSLDLSGWLPEGAALSPINPCFRADLRLSAYRVTAGDFRAGATAAAVNVNGGKVTANFAELEMFEGALRGNVEADLSGAIPVWTVRATGENLDISGMTDAAHLGVWLDGPVNANVELRAEGLTLVDALKSLNGQAKINFATGGSLGLPVIEALSGLSNGSTSLAEIVPATFSRLRADFGAVDGVLAARVIEITGEDTNLSGAGNADMANGAIDLQFDKRSTFATATAGGEASSIGAVSASKNSAKALSVQGTWTKPEISIHGKPVVFEGRNLPTPF